MFIKLRQVGKRETEREGLFLLFFYEIEKVACFYGVIEAGMEVTFGGRWCCENSCWQARGFHSFFEFFQTSTSVSINPEKHGEQFFYSFTKFRDVKKQKTTCLLWLSSCKFSLLAPAIITSTACASSVIPSSYGNTILSQSARVFSLDYFLNNKHCIKLFINNWKSSY